MSACPQITLLSSESASDRVWLDRLRSHLDVFQRKGLLRLWDRDQIAAGSLRSESLRLGLMEASAIVLLESTDLWNDAEVEVQLRPFLHGDRSPAVQLFGLPVRPSLGRDGLEAITWFSGGYLSEDPHWDRLLRNFCATLLDRLGVPQPEMDDGAKERTAALVIAYQNAINEKFRIWHIDPWLSLPHHGSLTVPFEDVFQPLRLSATDRGGEPIDVLSLIKPDCRVVVRAAGGQGKSTWLQALFRQLVQRPGVAPVLLKLRRIAAKLSEDSGWSCDFADEITAAGAKVDGWALGWTEFTAAVGRPLLVLLLDGWDEMGGNGLYVNEALRAFLARHPHVAVIVTSRRNDGVGVPSDREGFSSLSLQQFSDKDIEAFVHRYLKAMCLSDDDEEQEARTLLAFRSAPDDIREMARSPLLLTLILHNFRDAPLPHRRHVLFEEFIRVLLAKRPDKKTASGVAAPINVFRPGDGHERMMVTSALAAGMLDVPSAKGYMPEKLEKLLPSKWPLNLPTGLTREDARRGFLAWLEHPAGMLVRDEAGLLSFMNLSLQEYLTARHLNTSIEGEKERIQRFLDRSDDLKDWNVLILWAALLHGDDPTGKRLSAVLSPLLEGTSKQRRLAGMILAEGLGDDVAFHRWKEGFSELATSSMSDDSLLGMLHYVQGREPPLDSHTQCTMAWALSQNHERRRGLAQSLTQQLNGVDVLRHIAIRRLARACLIELGSSEPVNGSVGQALLAAFANPQIMDERAIAMKRLLVALDSECLAGDDGPDGPALIPLLLWPSQRRIVGQLMQCAAALGARREQLRGMGTKLLRPLIQDARWLEEERRSWIPALAGLRVGAQGNEGWPLPEFEAVYGWFQSNGRCGMAYHLAGRENAEEKTEASYKWLFESIMSMGRTSLDAVQRYIEDSSRRKRGWKNVLFNTSTDRTLGWFFGVAPETPWLGSYAKASVAICLQLENWKLLANLEGGPLSFFIRAHRSQIIPGDRSLQDEFHRDLLQHINEGDPIYAALARYLARAGTAEDERLLVAAASGFDQRPEPLATMLRVVVQGEVVTDEGSLTLDELSRECGFAHLPYLDRLPPELHISPEELADSMAMVKRNNTLRTHGLMPFLREHIAALIDSVKDEVDGSGGSVED